MNKWALFYLGLGVFTTVGCNIEIVEEDDDLDDWYEDSTVSERAQDTCQPYCLELISCGVLTDGALASCVDLCVERYIADESLVSDGCSCVISSACDQEQASECEGAPVPGVWQDGDPAQGSGGQNSGGGGQNASGGSGSASDGAGGSAGGSSSEDDGPSCTTNHQCGSAEDCVEDQCLARCAASCQCQEGQACEEGYCRSPEQPQIECNDTCDCTAGDQCVDGQCE